MGKTCKQCGLYLDDTAYRKYAARGKGIYKTEQGYHTICKDCESINNRALQLERLVDKTQEQQQLYDKLVKYYAALETRGLGIASAVAGRYLGKDKSNAASPRRSILDKLDSVIESTASNSAAAFMDRLRGREFADSAEAWTAYDEYKPVLKASGLRTEAARLIEDWELEEEG